MTGNEENAESSSPATGPDRILNHRQACPLVPVMRIHGPGSIEYLRLNNDDDLLGKSSKQGQPCPRPIRRPPMALIHAAQPDR